MPKDSHIFLRRPSKQRSVEQGLSNLLRLVTYCVIIAASFIFLKIAYHGSSALFIAEAPFINTQFLTKKPQTLHVFEPRKSYDALKQANGQILRLESKQRALGKNNVADFEKFSAQIQELEAKIKILNAERKANRLTYSDDAFRALSEEPSLENYAYNTYAYSGGGIGPAIAGTCLLVAGSIAIALTLGVLCAIFLSEYSQRSATLYLIRISIQNLAGVPSIVFGLFGFGMFVLFLDWGVSMIAGWFTLAIMALPVIITASEESMRAIPKGFREGSLALGASKWKTIQTNVIPYAIPGILTSSIMGVARVAGETAPIMFTAAFALRDQLPWEGLDNWYDFFFQGVMALPYHIYVVSSKIPQNEYTQRMQYGAAFVFLIIVSFFALTSIILRIKVRKKYKW